MTTTSTAIVVYDPELAGPEHIALAGFLGGYRGLTRDAYALDLRQFVAFCDGRHLGLFDVRRSDIEAYGRELDSIATPRRKASSPTLRQSTSVVLGSTMNPTPLAWTETRLEHSSSRPDSGLQLSTHWSHCWR